LQRINNPEFKKYVKIFSTTNDMSLSTEFFRKGRLDGISIEKKTKYIEEQDTKVFYKFLEMDIEKSHHNFKVLAEDENFDQSH